MVVMAVRSLRWVFFCVVCTVLASCASHLPVEAPVSAPVSVSDNSAVQSLYQQAMDNKRRGDFDQAEASLERGLRIEPSNPGLWFELAQLAAAYGDTQKARQRATRAQSLAGGDASLRNRIGRFLADL